MTRIDEGVADLFELTDPERNLVVDFWAAQRKGATRSVSVGKEVTGTESDLDPRSKEGLEPYLRVSLELGIEDSATQGNFSGGYGMNLGRGVIALVFETREAGVHNSPVLHGDEDADWLTALRRIGVQWATTHSQSILRYGMVRAVTDTAIVLVKRDEQPLWTASAAWQDADATLAQLISVQQQ